MREDEHYVRPGFKCRSVKHLFHIKAKNIIYLHAN